MKGEQTTVRVFMSAGAAYPWTEAKAFFFRGYFVVEDTCYRGSAAIEYLCGQLETLPAKAVLERLNGVFSIIWEREEEILFAVDRLRGLPLFYTAEGKDLWIGDDMQALSYALPAPSGDALEQEGYASTKLFVPGKGTLLRGVFQVRASTFCRFFRADGSVMESEYYHMHHRDFWEDTDVQLQRFHEAYHTAGRHLARALDGRTAVVPLSGGADSRMVLSMLKEQGYEKVLCFTYGCPGNREAEISRQVAESYGYPWTFIPYTVQLWKELRAAPELEEYERFASAYSSTPHLQDFPAVREMKRKGLLPPDSVFVPGHSGDMLAGSHITPEFLGETLSREAFLGTIESKFFMEPPSQALWSEISAGFPPCDETDMEELAAQSEWFNTQERQAKFIVNSVRVYEFFGYEWLIPLWDHALFSFWSHIPIPQRYQRRLYFMAVEGPKIASTNDASVRKSLAASARKLPGVRTLLRRTARLMRYWRSPLMIERLFPLGPYGKGCFCEPPLFDVNYLLCRQEIRRFEKDFHIQKEK